MTFERFCNLSYRTKLRKCNTAYRSLLQRQAKVNRLLNVFRHQQKMQEIFNSLLHLNSFMRETFAKLFDSTFSVKHELFDKKSTPKRMAEVSVDICHLLENFTTVTKSDSDIDVLFLVAHSIKSAQINLWKSTYIYYDWNAIFSSKSPVVGVAPPQTQYNYQKLSSNELKAKYKGKN